MKPNGPTTTPYERVLAGLVALALILSIGTTGYMLIEGWGFLDALYMSVTAVTTVGFAEVHPLSSEGRVFTIGLLLVGVGAAFYILTAMVAAIIEGDLGQVFGARRMKSAIDKLKDHYIVCGYGRVGEEIARELKDRQSPCVVVDLDPVALERARAAGLLVVTGDATSEEALIAAGIQRCRALMAAAESDAVNTYITLTAKGLNQDAFVVARVSTSTVEAKLRQAGADRIVSPYEIGGRRMAFAALQPIVTEFIDIVPHHAVQRDRILAEFVIDEASGLAGKALNEALASCHDVVVLALRNADGKMAVGPAGSTRLTLGDTLMVVGAEDELRTVGSLTTPKAG